MRTQAPVGTGDASVEGERKTVTALFADIRGSTKLMEDLDPEEASPAPLIRLPDSTNNNNLEPSHNVIRHLPEVLDLEQRHDPV